MGHGEAGAGVELGEEVEENPRTQARAPVPRREPKTHPSRTQSGPEGSRGARCIVPLRDGLEDGEEEVFGVGAPALDGLRADQGGSLTFGFIAHEEGIAVGKIGGDFAVIGQRDVGAVFA